MIDPDHLETVCAHLHGKVGDYVYRYYRQGYLQRCDYYTPTNPRTAPQQLWRKVFADAIKAWQALSEEEKDWWREEAKKRRMVGAHLFRSHYLKTHQPYSGVALVDFAVVGSDQVG
jgi:hypothetical protein